MAAHPDLDADTLRTIAKGLALTVKNREALYQRVRAQCEARIADLEERARRRAGEGDEECPEGYIPNNGRIPQFYLPIGDGMGRPARWIKKLEDGKVAGLSGLDGADGVPHIIDIFAAPDRTNDTPAEPLLPWFRRYLWGPAASYNVLADAINDLDRWDIAADVERYRVLDEETNRLRRRIEVLQADLQSYQEAKELCEGRLVLSRVQDRLSHLESRPHPYKAVHRHGGWKREKGKYRAAQEYIDCDDK
jgi:hypothetical protein